MAMAPIIRNCRSPAVAALLQQAACRRSSGLRRPLVSQALQSRPSGKPFAIPITSANAFSTTRPHLAGSSEPPPTDFGALDVLGSTPVPSTSVDICMSSGFQLNNGARTTDGSGVLLVGGEAFRWQPWQSGSQRFRLFNKKGQFDIPASTLGLLSLVWPRPDLLIFGLGPEIRPISPDLRKAVSAMGMRIEVLDTRNAAAQFNLLATERGVDDIAAALVPIGWKEGVGAGKGDPSGMTHE